MEYLLHFYALSAEALRRLPAEPPEVRAFVEAQGERLGALEFGPGESILFLSAVEELTGQELMDLLQAPVGESEPTEQAPFGGMDAEGTRRIVAALDEVLDQVDAQTSGLAPLAEAHDLTPERLLALLKDLRGLLQQALEADGELVTLYA